jgi:hypothetical protein
MFSETKYRLREQQAQRLGLRISKEEYVVVSGKGAHKEAVREVMVS